MIDWPKRLAAKEPFYRHWFQQVGVPAHARCGLRHRASCGYVPRLELEVEAADLSPAMIQRAGKNIVRRTAGPRWTVRRFHQPVAAPGTWDVVVCADNSVVFVPIGSNRVPRHPSDDGRPAAGRGAAGAGAQSVAFSGGRPLPLASSHAYVLIALRRDARPHGGGRGVRRRAHFKGVHRSGDRGFVELVVADPAGGCLWPRNRRNSWLGNERSGGRRPCGRDRGREVLRRICRPALLSARPVSI